MLSNMEGETIKETGDAKAMALLKQEQGQQEHKQKNPADTIGMAAAGLGGTGERTKTKTKTSNATYRVVNGRGPVCFTNEKHLDYVQAMKTLEGLAYRMLCRMPEQTATFEQLAQALREKETTITFTEDHLAEMLEKMEEAGWLK